MKNEEGIFRIGQSFLSVDEKHHALDKGLSRRQPQPIRQTSTGDVIAFA
jgi:hypothetical protein